MKIETKEVVILTNEENKLINDTHMLMCEIMENTNNTELYKVVKNILDFMEEFGNLVD